MNARTTATVVAACGSVALAALGEESFYALVEWPVGGEKFADLTWVSEDEVLRPAFWPTAAGVGLLVIVAVLVYLRRRLSGPVVALLIAAGWCTAASARRPWRPVVDAVLYDGTTGKAPPTPAVSTASIAGAVALAAVAVVLSRSCEGSRRA